jgi:predicted GNAT family acetyltransferase
MSPAMVAAGFVDAGELWPPWCVATVDGEIAAAAFAARTGAGGLEVGVYTLEAFRGRALAAAVTAAWTRLPSLQARTLFYSTSISNRASQAVTVKLGLRRFGVSLAVG